MHIRILFLLLSFSFMSFAAQMSQPGTAQSVAEQQTSVYTRKTWTCRCYSRCFTRLCKRWSTTPVVSPSADGKQSEPIEVRTRAASRADIELRKRGSSSAAASPTTVGRTGSPSPLYIVQSDRRLSSVPNSSFQPLPGLSDA